MENDFEKREQASAAAARHIAGLLKTRLDNLNEASLVVSGGTTPRLCLDALSNLELDWAHVHVLLSDERWVPPDDPDSNERLVRDALLRNRAAAATLVPYYADGSDPSARCEELDATIRTLPIPFAGSLVGMGEDGHFASLFPDIDNLAEGLDKNSTRLCLPVHTAASPHPRISLTLAALSRSDEIVLLFFGDRKREVYEQAKTSGNTWPVAHLLKQKQAPVRVFWAP